MRILQGTNHTGEVAFFQPLHRFIRYIWQGRKTATRKEINPSACGNIRLGALLRELLRQLVASETATV